MRHRSVPAIGVFVGTICISITAVSAASHRCAAPAYRQFDFWLGTWDVTAPSGGLAGSNHIEKAADGCALVERWTGTRGGRGTSLNFYETATKQWHQVWVDNEGEVLRLSGGIEQGKMVLSGVSSSNGETRQRITWTPISPGRVRQVWEVSEDGGHTWKAVFDGQYTRRPSTARLLL